MSFRVQVSSSSDLLSPLKFTYVSYEEKTCIITYRARLQVYEVSGQFDKA